MLAKDCLASLVPFATWACHLVSLHPSFSFVEHHLHFRVGWLFLLLESDSSLGPMQANLLHSDQGLRYSRNKLRRNRCLALRLENETGKVTGAWKRVGIREHKGLWRNPSHVARYFLHSGFHSTGFYINLPSQESMFLLHSEQCSWEEHLSKTHFAGIIKRAFSWTLVMEQCSGFDESREEEISIYPLYTKQKELVNPTVNPPSFLRAGLWVSLFQVRLKTPVLEENPVSTLTIVQSDRLCYRHLCLKRIATWAVVITGSATLGTRFKSVYMFHPKDEPVVFAATSLLWYCNWLLLFPMKHTHSLAFHLHCCHPMN